MGNRKVNRKLAPKHKSKAKYAIEKETNNFNIRIVTVTASQIRKATKDIKDKQFQNPRHLYRVPSHVERSKIYAETAKAISQKESEALPSHGGRKWKCDVIVSDLLGASSLIGHNKHKRDGTSTKRKSFPLFRWYRGKLELACLPHFFETIEVLDGGYTSVMKHWVAEYGTDWLFDNEDLDGMYYNKKQRVSEERQIDALSNFAWNDDKYSVPIIERKWMSPDLVPFRSRSAARKHAEELLRRDRLIDRVLYGFGTRMKPLKPQKPSKKQALDAGYFRFLRDGIWVIGQEESWLDQRLIDQDNSKKGKELEGTIGKCCVNIEFVSNDVKQGKSDSLPSIKSYQSQEKNISKPLNLKIHIDSSSTYSLCSDSHERDGIHKTFRIPTSHHWRLKPSQITDCYDAVMDHYNKVMYTVKARALFSELDDGFDVFRERGRGRFDMTLSAFDEAAFNFLNTMENTSWMPVVRKILGKDVNLVHKGAFLSMPDSEKQVYHQDGVHLTNKYHRACHAINVFIPLVDLDKSNGPTEFCLGTHMLGNECFSKDMVEIPLVKAGTPIIFDYRLGHRGLGNTSTTCRPIVYLTYTSSKDGFHDSVNFSKKRYRKLGEIIAKPLSRDERARRRSK